MTEGQNREQWLGAAVEELREPFQAAGFKLPPHVHVSVGWPSSGGLAEKKVVRSQSWAPETSDDKTAHVFISPVLADSLKTIDALVHELVHVLAGPRKGHRGPFVKVMVRLGLQGLPTEATIDHEDDPETGRMLAVCKAIIDKIGQYPHARIAPPERKVQGTRMLKVMCPECGYTLRTTRKWLDEGLPTCTCDTPMVEEEGLDEDDPLVSVTATHKFTAHTGRFDVIYSKRLVKDRSVDVKWLVTDHGPEGPQDADAWPRLTPLAARADVIGFMEAVLEGAYTYSKRELEQADPYAETWDLDADGIEGLLFLREDEPEELDNEDGVITDPDELAAYEDESAKREAAGARKSKQIAESGGDGALD